MADKKNQNDFIVEVTNQPTKEHIKIKQEEISKLLSNELSRVK